MVYLQCKQQHNRQQQKSNSRHKHTPVQIRIHHLIPHRHFQGIYAARVWLITSLEPGFRNLTWFITLHVHTACAPAYHIVGPAG